MPSETRSRPSFALPLLLWLPLLAFELLQPYPLGHFLLSPVLRKGFFLAALVCLGIVLTLYAGSVAVMRSMKRTSADPHVAWLASTSAPPLASVLLLRYHLPLQQWLFREHHLDPAVGLLVALLAALVASTAAVVLVGILIPRRRASVLAWIPCLGAFALWGYTVAMQFNIASSISKSMILALCCLSLVAILVRRSFPPFRRIRLFEALAVGGAAFGAVLTLMRADQGSATSASFSVSPAATADVNVLMIMIDTLRADHTELGGHAKRTTPNLQTIAADRATYFTNATSAGASTIPSVKSVFTGFPPSYFGGDGGINFPPRRMSWTLARAFGKAGYVTAGFSANGLVDGPGFKNGFDEFAAFGGHKYFRGSYFLYDLLSGGDYWRSFRNMARLHVHKETAPNVRTMARDWLERHREDRFFLYVHFLDPHWPYYDRGSPALAPALDAVEPYSHVDLLRVRNGNPRNARYRRNSRLLALVGRYDMEIAFVDRTIGRMFDDLEELGLADSTLVVVLADHGEEFFEHDGYSHGHDVYQEQVHVPLLFRWPRRPEFQGAQKRIRTPVSLVDVLPTLTDYLGLPPAPRKLFGTSLRPLIEGETRPDWPPVLSESSIPKSNKKAYRRGTLKVRFSYPPTATLETAKDISVFDLAKDPQERRPLPPRNPRRQGIVARASREIPLRLEGPKTGSAAPSG